MSTLATINLKNPDSASNNILLGTDGGVTVTTIQGIIKQGTAVASTSGTAIDFTSIPSWVKRVTIMFNGVSTSGTSNPLVQIGAGSFTTSGYSSAAGSSTYSSGFGLGNWSAATNTIGGLMIITNISANTWVYASTTSNTATTPGTINAAGYVALSSALDRVRITTVNGTDTFDAGSINILYEG